MGELIDEDSICLYQVFLMKKDIQSALKACNHQPILLKSSQKQILYSLKLQHPNIRGISLTTMWTISFTSQIEIKVEMSSQEMKKLEPNPDIQIKTLVQKLNLQSKGVYFTNSSFPHMLQYRCIIQQCMSRHYIFFREIIQQVELHFINFAIKLNLFGGNTIHQGLIALNNLKMHFEMNRQSRKKATIIYLEIYSIKIVNEALKIMNCDDGNRELAKYKILNNRPSKGQIKLNKKMYQKCLKQAQAHQNTQGQKQLKHIVLGIQIKQKKQEIEAKQAGAHSKIYKGIYYASTNISVNTPEITLNKPIIMKIEEGLKSLVRKESNGVYSPSYSNQIEFLEFIRSNKCKRIAQYYLSKVEMKNKKISKTIYLDYYETTLFQKMQSMSQSSLFNASIQILQGISFLYDNRLLHRDLKEQNIMIDSTNNVRIIDFGSCCLMQEHKIANPPKFNLELYSTESYYYQYKDIAKSSSDRNKLSNDYTKEQFYQSHTFDVYSFGQIMRNLFRFQRDSLIYRQLEYLANKCQQLNPDDRLTPNEAMAYLYKIFQLKKKWNHFTIKDQKQLQSLAVFDLTSEVCFLNRDVDLNCR